MRVAMSRGITTAHRRTGELCDLVKKEGQREWRAESKDRAEMTDVTRQTLHIWSQD